jgi:DNA-binding NarL/FixJ family response regulator
MKPEAVTSVLLYDPLFLTRKGIASLIHSLQEFSIIDQIEQESNFLEKYVQTTPDLVVLHMAGFNSELLEILKSTKQRADPNILVIISNPSIEVVQELLKSGIKGMVSQTCSEIEIVNALKAVAEGKRFFCHCILDLMVGEPLEKKKTHPSTNLSSRELEVLQLIARGYSSSRISQELYISVHTVNSHRKNILKKLNLKSPIQLITYALEHGLDQTKTGTES